MTSRALTLWFVLFATGTVQAASAPEWTGRGGHRLLVSVPPVEIGAREQDEMIAQLAVDFAEEIKRAELKGQVDLATLQVHKFDPETGRAEKFKPFDSALSEWDRPCRFEDTAVPDDYPDRANYASDQPNGKGPVTLRKRGGRLFNRLMNNQRGRLTWVHTQRGKQVSHYAIYFDLKPEQAITGPSPAPWIGDVDVLRRPEGQHLTGLSHFTVCAGDLNGDGLFDLMGGAEKGDLMWFPNRGKPGEPRFDGCIMMTDEDGPVDCGWYSAPFIADLNDDGLPDVLSGTSHNVIVWWKNAGSRTEPKFIYQGFLQADGKKLEVPESPVPEDSNRIFARDYYNQPWVGDWDGDGLPDLLTGGYTTGLIFHYKGVGRDSSGTVQFKYVGPLKAGHEPIDTIWAAAPCAADFDGDGRMELITGGWFWSGIMRQPAPGEDDYLRYYRNAGSPERPRYERAEFPAQGNFPQGNIARPNAVDWNNDGLLDLLVSDGSGSVYVFLNRGSPSRPMFELNARPLTVPWGFAREYGWTASMDMDGDGQVEHLMGQVFQRQEGSPYSPTFRSVGSPTAEGKRIWYPGPGYGDPYYYTTVCDWDKDGRADLLWGTQQGNIYLHRGRDHGRPLDFAVGVELKLTSGEPLRVGPPVVDSPEKAKDFTILQGSRIIMTVADFDGDGIDDLGITETYGKIWVFRNTRSGGVDTLAPGVEVGKVVGGGRSDDLVVLDWNEDGKPDLMVGQTAAKPGAIYLNRSTPGKPRFDAPIQPLGLPFVFWGASLKPTDWNGDGDEDFIIHSEFYAFFAEKSFLLHGYRPAEVSAAIQVKAGGR